MLTCISVDKMSLIIFLSLQSGAGSVVECLSRSRGLRVRASPASLCCVLEQDALILAQYWFNLGRPSRHN